MATFAAAGYSLVYLLAGGGLFGAIVFFFIAKMLGRYPPSTIDISSTPRSTRA